MDERSEAGAVFPEVVIEVFRVDGLSLEAGDRLTRPAGLSSARRRVLGVVEHEPSPVARVVGPARQGVRQTADAVARDGLVEYRENARHRRAKLVGMPPKGRDAPEYVRRRQSEWASRIGERRSSSELRAAKVLRQVREGLEQDGLPPSAANGHKAGGDAPGEVAAGTALGE